MKVIFGHFQTKYLRDSLHMLNVFVYCMIKDAYSVQTNGFHVWVDVHAAIYSYVSYKIPVSNLMYIFLLFRVSRFSGYIFL